MKYLFVFLLVGLMLSCGGGVEKKATVSAEIMKKNNSQPNCKDLEGLQPVHPDSIPESYTGVVFYCQEGKVTLLENYKDGKEDGLWRAWHENGQLWQVFNLKDGEFDGLWRAWHENGQLNSETNYKDGKEDGLCRYWHENGQLSSEANYKDGKLIDEKCWYEDGTLNATGCF